MRKLVYFLILSASVSGPATAQDRADNPPIILADPYRETLITVLGTGTPDTIRTTGQPLTVIGSDEIDEVQGGDVTRVLERAPGLSLTRNGGPGSFTGVSLRGAAAEQLLVLIDGVRMADPASPGGGYDFGTLLPAGIGKIEILRGSNGTVWGSQAIGGVLAAWSDTTPGARASAEYGARDTAYGTASAGIEQGPLRLAADGAWYRTDGFSAAAAGTEPDGFRQWQAGGHGSVSLTSALSLRGSVRYAKARLDLDGYPAPDFVLADTAEYQDTRQLSAFGGFAYSGNNLQLQGNWSSADTERDNWSQYLDEPVQFNRR